MWSAFILMVARRFGEHYRRSIESALENLDLVASMRERNAENEALNAA
ncbi:MAG: hypothetical protein AAGA68_26320 [Pseudomonadota bacterium]